MRDSKAGECSVVVEAGGGSVVLERRAVVIGGASDSDSYTDESGNVWETEIGFADHLPKYRHWGSKEEAFSNSDLSLVTTSEVFDPT